MITVHNRADFLDLKSFEFLCDTARFKEFELRLPEKDTGPRSHVEWTLDGEDVVRVYARFTEKCFPSYLRKLGFEWKTYLVGERWADFSQEKCTREFESLQGESSPVEFE